MSAQRLQRRLLGVEERDLLPLALVALTFTTAMVHAASYLGLGHVFTANMTGNVVLLGFAVAGGSGLTIAAPVVSLAGFLVGAVAGGRLAVGLAARRQRWVLVALGVETVLVAAAAALAIGLRSGVASGGRHLAVIAVLGAGMGVRNATVRKLAVPDLTTTVLTLTLTGLASDSPAAGGESGRPGRRLTAAAAMLAGAVVGALLVRHHLALTLAITAALVLATLAPYALAPGEEAARR